MKTSLSLRVRLTVLILLPLVLVAALVGGWAYLDAQGNAAERFDRSLLSTALAISRDTAATGGDALSEDTRDLLRDTSGGAVFYHVYAPDGVFVTGYATPPVPPDIGTGDDAQNYFNAVYRGEQVRALRFTQQASIDGLTGLFTFTVWQATTVLDGYVRSRTVPVFAIIASLIGALTIIVWFGVRRGLAPLLSLEEAIARRSVDDLSPIRRRIPQEVTGIVDQFNSLISELSMSMTAKDAFISDASHQLRNPIAGVIALADAVINAKDIDVANQRARDLRVAAGDLGHLTESLLTLERIKSDETTANATTFDAIAILKAIAAEIEASMCGEDVRLEISIPADPCFLNGDPVMFEQAVLNVIHNALHHGGPNLSVVSLRAERLREILRVSIQDDGKGVEPEDHQRALGRFSQVGPSAGSGLGLPIAAAVVQNFGGTIELEKRKGDFTVSLVFRSSGSASGGRDSRFASSTDRVRAY